MTTWDLDTLRLRNGDVRAWTALAQAQVRRVKVMPMRRGWSGAKLVKYRVALDEGQVLEYVGKRIHAGEARVLEVLSGKPPIDIPRVYFVQAGWCVMEALPIGKPPVEWTAGDTHAALTNLACLHAAFWDCAPDWLGRLDSAGLNRRLDRAARGLDLIERIGGWPGLIEPGLMSTMRWTLDHRERFIAPLLDQPVTLLHGDAWMSNWNIAGDRCSLLDWSEAAAGPAVWDVNYFSEIAAVYQAADGRWQVCLPPVGRDEAVTFYLDRLEHTLGQKVDRAAFTSALAAAFVVNTLTLWMGFAEDYGAWTNLMSAVGWLLARLPEPLRRALEGLALQNQGDFLRQTFARFESYVTEACQV